MSTIKTILSVLALLCAFGVAGRMDYHDAVMKENARKQAARKDRLRTVSASSMRPIRQVQTERPDRSAETQPGPVGPCKVLPC